MSHGDQVEIMPEGFFFFFKTSTCPIADYANEGFGLYGLQFHPEVNHTPKGMTILENFISKIVQAKKQWKLENWIEKAIESIQREIGKDRVILGLSGGGKKHFNRF